MKTKALHALAAIGLTALITGSASAQTAVSKPVGYYTENLGTGFNLVGVNLHGKVLASGTLTAESGADVTDSTKDFSTILNDATATYIIEFASGTVAEITNVAGDTLTLAGAVGAGVGADYSIRQAETLASVFGTNLTQGATDASADVVWVPDGTAGGFTRYFSSSLGGGEFRDATNAFASPAKPPVVFYPDAVFVERKGGAIDIVISGAVKTTGTVVNMPTGFYPVTVSGPVGSTLQNSGLGSVLTAGATDASADVVWVPGAPGVFDRYFVSSLGAPGEFRDATNAFSPLPGDVDLGSAVLIERKGASTSAEFAVPSFYSSL